MSMTAREVLGFARVLPTLEPCLKDKQEYWELFAFRIIDYLENEKR